MPDDVLHKTNKSLFHRLFFKGGQQVISLILGIWLARILSPSEFGIIALANIIIYYANTFTNFGLNNALVQHENLTDEHVNTVFTIDFIVSLILMGGTYLFSNKIALFFHNVDLSSVLRWMSLYYVITTFYYIPVVILRRNIDFRFMSVVEFCEALFTSVLTIFLALNGYSYWSIVFSSLSIPVLVSLIYIWKTGWCPRLVLGRNMRALYSFGFWNFISAQVQLLVSKVDYFVIGRYLNVESLGIYEKSFELSTRAMSGLAMPVHGIFFSTFSRLQKDFSQIRQVFLEGSALLALICYPVLLGLAAVAPHFVIACLGAQWTAAVLPIQILAITSMFRVLLGMTANVNVAIGQYRKNTLVNIVSAVIFIGLCFWWVRYGLLAMCFAYFIYILLSFVSTLCIVINNVKLKIRDLLGVLWCPFIGSCMMFALVTTLRLTIWSDSNSLVQLFFLVGSGAVFYAIWSYFFYRLGVIRLTIRGAE